MSRPRIHHDLAAVVVAAAAFLLLTDFAPPGAHAQTYPDERDYPEPVNATYHLYQLSDPDAGIAHLEADSRCRSRGRYLASVLSAADETLLLSDIRGLTYWGPAWLGGSDAGHEGEWYWKYGRPGANETKFWDGDVNGTAPPGAYANWNPGAEPGGGGVENGLLLTNYGLSWDDHPEDAGDVSSYVCEDPRE